MRILRGMLMLDFFFFLSWFGWFSMEKFPLGLGPVSYESMN